MQEFELDMFLNYPITLMDKFGVLRNFFHFVSSNTEKEVVGGK